MTLDRPQPHEFTVTAQRQEIMFRDGTTVHLSPVFENLEPCPYHRALSVPPGVVIVDLRRLVSTIGADLCCSPQRDVPGLVFYTLRNVFPSAPAFLEAALDVGHAHVQPLAVAA